PFSSALLLSSFSFLFLLCHGDHRCLRCFPTRRSSDLEDLPYGSVTEMLSLIGFYTHLGKLLFCGLRRQTVHVIVVDEPNDFCLLDRKSTRLNSSHVSISYAVFCLKKKINCQEMNIVFI